MMVANKIWKQFVDFLGFSEDAPREAHPHIERQGAFETDTKITKRDRVVPLKSIETFSTDFVVFYPASFADVKEVSDYLQQRRPVVINLENTTSEDAKRLLDFMSGTIYALQGQSQKVGEYTFLFVPRGININSQGIKDE